MESQVLDSSRAALRALAAWMLAFLLILGAGSLAGCGSGAERTGGADSTGAGDSSQVASGDEDDGGGDEGEEDGEDGDSKKPKREKSTTLNAAKVERMDLVIPVIAEGSIRARNATAVTAEINGRIERVHVEEGQAVRRGQRLFTLDDRDYQIALEEARSRYLEAVGKLAVDGRGEPNPQAAELMAQKLQEIDAAYAAGKISKEERDAQALDVQVTAVKAGAYRDELLEVRSGLAEARAAVERAELNLERTTVTAPFAGVVSGIVHSAGVRITSAETLCQLTDNVNIEAAVAVLESDLAGLEPGRLALIEIPALRDTAKVDVINPRIDTASRTCEVLLRVQNTDGQLRPGMYVRAAIASEIHPDKLLVPREAILTRDGRPLLFKIEDDRAKWVYVAVGKQNERYVEIENVLQGGPLDPGTLVVVSDHLTLTHEAKVKVRKVVAPQSLWAAADGQ